MSIWPTLACAAMSPVTAALVSKAKPSTAWPDRTMATARATFAVAASLGGGVPVVLTGAGSAGS